ncbi:MAG TPA: type II toxin-antitoxin system ParD family antitoxin [Gemmataceae bacterium]|jgi:antitoxin ParD1/3/4|nr:type II toxin-antitoxin system ParD family antitoxin [Gemmataceae bacterium]
MTTLNISLPKAMREFIDEQIAEGSYGTASEYIRELVRVAQKQKAREAIEALLLEGLQSEGREMTRDDWKELRRRVQERHGKRKAQ